MQVSGVYHGGVVLVFLLAMFKNYFKIALRNL
jgi:hypothetical protein